MKKSNLIYVGVDDGHYATKVVTEKGCFSYPSRARSGRHLVSFGGNANSGGLYQTEEGISYTVNESFPDYEDTRFAEFPKSPLNRVLVHHGLVHAGLGGQDVKIATGLPYSYFYRLNGEKNEALIKAKEANLQRGVSSERELAVIKRNIVSPEALAAYVDLIMDMDGNDSPEAADIDGNTIGIVDIGGKTTDCAVVMHDRTPDPRRSGSENTGVLALNDQVGDALRLKFSLDYVDAVDLERIIRGGKMFVDGRDHNVQAIVEDKKAQVANDIIAAIQRRIGTGRELRRVVMVGGGSIVLQEQLKQQFPNAYFPPNPEYANARGMYKIAKYVDDRD